MDANHLVLRPVPAPSSARAGSTHQLLAAAFIWKFWPHRGKSGWRSGPRSRWERWNVRNPPIRRGLNDHGVAQGAKITDIYQNFHLLFFVSGCGNCGAGGVNNVMRGPEDPLEDCMLTVAG